MRADDADEMEETDLRADDEDEVEEADLRADDEVDLRVDEEEEEEADDDNPINFLPPISCEYPVIGNVDMLLVVSAALVILASEKNISAVALDCILETLLVSIPISYILLSFFLYSFTYIVKISLVIEKNRDC